MKTTTTTPPPPPTNTTTTRQTIRSIMGASPLPCHHQGYLLWNRAKPVVPCLLVLLTVLNVFVPMDATAFVVPTTTIPPLTPHGTVTLSSLLTNSKQSTRTRTLHVLFATTASNSSTLSLGTTTPRRTTPTTAQPKTKILYKASPSNPKQASAKVTSKRQDSKRHTANTATTSGAKTKASTETRAANYKPSVSSSSSSSYPPSSFYKDKKGKRTPQEQEFDWLHWVYQQWKDTAAGDLTEESILKQMAAAIPHWARRKSLDAANRAEELLNRLIQEALAGNQKVVSVVTCPTGNTAASATSTTIPASTSTALSNRAWNGSTAKEECHLKVDSNSTAVTAITPPILTVSLFNAAMDGYGKIGNPEGVQRILRRMETLRKRRSDLFAHLRPDEFSMSTLATAWAKSRSPDAAHKAEAILQYMDLNGMIPNTITYNAVLNAIAVGNQVDKALIAEDIVQQMKKRHKENKEDCEPDVYTYQSLIQAWSKTSLPGAPQKAEEILRYMEEASEKNKRLNPNEYCFTTVIHAWARSSEKNRARNAYQLLNIMTRRYYDIANTSKTSRRNRPKPNVKTFTAVLNACARPVDESEKEDAFAIAQITMAELSLGTFGKPNFLSFAAFLSVCGTALEAGRERDAIVKATFEDCIKSGEVGQIVLEKLFMSASRDLLDELIGKYHDDQGQIHIPNHWRSNIRGERSGVKMEEADVSKIPKSFLLRLQAVQKCCGTSGAYSRSHPATTVVGEKGEEIIWSKHGFRSGRT